MTKIVLSLVFLLSCTLHGVAQNEPLNYAPANGPLVDGKVFETIAAGGNELLNANKTAPLTTIASQLSNTKCHLNVKPSRRKVLDMPALYAKCKPGVLIVATMYRCAYCPEDHIRAASGFAVAEDGVGVTSYHIFQGDATNENYDLAHVVMDYYGNVFPVTAVLAAHKGDDVAIFQFDTQRKKVTALPLGNDPQVGQEAAVIAHPHTMFYSFTQGTVSRLYMREGREKVSITADFSQGSSGGPVFDNKGNVIGVVSATLSLYHADKNLQMVSKEAIPVKRIKALIVPQANH